MSSSNSVSGNNHPVVLLWRPPPYTYYLFMPDWRLNIINCSLSLMGSLSGKLANPLYCAAYWDEWGEAPGVKLAIRTCASDLPSFPFYLSLPPLISCHLLFMDHSSALNLIKVAMLAMSKLLSKSHFLKLNYWHSDQFILCQGGILSTVGCLGMCLSGFCPGDAICIFLLLLTIQTIQFCSIVTVNHLQTQ